MIDTTGAGDTWFGALLTALRHDMPLEQAGKFANRAAADCCTALGASAGVKSFEETSSNLSETLQIADHGRIAIPAICANLGFKPADPSPPSPSTSCVKNGSANFVPIRPPK